MAKEVRQHSKRGFYFRRDMPLRLLDAAFFLLFLCPSEEVARRHIFSFFLLLIGFHVLPLHFFFSFSSLFLLFRFQPASSSFSAFASLTHHFSDFSSASSLISSSVRGHFFSLSSFIAKAHASPREPAAVPACRQDAYAPTRQVWRQVPRALPADAAICLPMLPRYAASAAAHAIRVNEYSLAALQPLSGVTPRAAPLTPDVCHCAFRLQRATAARRRVHVTERFLSSPRSYFVTEPVHRQTRCVLARAAFPLFKTITRRCDPQPPLRTTCRTIQHGKTRQQVRGGQRSSACAWQPAGSGQLAGVARSRQRARYRRLWCATVRTGQVKRQGWRCCAAGRVARRLQGRAATAPQNDQPVRHAIMAHTFPTHAEHAYHTPVSCRHAKMPPLL